MRHLRPFADLSVIAPVPYFPRLKIHKRWFEFAVIPRVERLAGFDLDHPRFFVLPKMGMATHGFSMFLGSLHQVLNRMRKTSYDVIDAHYIYPDGFAAILLAAVFNKPVVISARGSDINVFPKFNTIRPLIRRVLNRADALIAVSQSLKDTMVRLGCPPEKITVIANGVDVGKFQPQPQAEARYLLQLPQHRPIVLSVGHLTENKGFHILVEAVAMLRARLPDVLLVIVGEGDYRPYLERKIRALAVQDNVFLAGAQAHERLSAWYSAADVFCLASLTEGSPNVLLEAMACGRPVIATREWGAATIVSSSLGILVERKAEEFQAAVEQALGREWENSAIVAHARSHGWDQVAQSVMNVLSAVVTRRNAEKVDDRSHLHA